MNKQLLYYDNLSGFKSEFRRELLFPEHVVGGQIKIDKMSTPDGDSDTSYNFWGYKLEKDGRKYLLSTVDKSTNKEINIADILPIKAKKLLKLASGGEVLYQIEQPVPMKILPKQTMSFKELVDFLSSLGHTNQKHYKLSWLLALAQIFLRANFRLATPPGFGKDSIVDILGNLIGNCATIETPTLAKLEERSIFLKLMAVNEVVDLAPSEWRTIQQFLLSAGAFKTEITKHSRAFKDTGEVLHVNELSLQLLYNDIDCYQNSDEYVDFVSKKPLLDRFPPLRFNGRINEDFNSAKHIDTKSFIKEHYDNYVDLIKNILFYKENATALIKTHYKGPKELQDFFDDKRTPERWKTNLGRLVSVLSMYAESEEEFNVLCYDLLLSLQDYQQMLRYPSMLPVYYKRIGIPEIKYSKWTGLQQLIDYQRSVNDDKLSYSLQIQQASTFTMKNTLMQDFKRTTKIEDTKDGDLWN